VSLKVNRVLNPVLYFGEYKTWYKMVKEHTHVINAQHRNTCGTNE